MTLPVSNLAIRGLMRVLHHVQRIKVYLYGFVSYIQILHTSIPLDICHAVFYNAEVPHICILDTDSFSKLGQYPVWNTWHITDRSSTV